MQAALITGRQQVELVDFPEPEPKAGQAAVQISYCGICGTDIHAYQSGREYNPAICGHEWAGTVSAVGAGVTSLSEGDRVAAGAAPPCGRCPYCTSGLGPWCQTAFLGVVGLDPLAPPHGGFAPAIALGADRLMPVPAALSDIEAAQVEPATVAFHAVRKAHIRLGDTVAVQGAGPIGLMTMQLAIAAGAANTVVVEPNPQRRALAGDLGATAVTTPDEAPELLAEATRGLGPDVVFECVGRPETIASAIARCRRGGKTMLVGLAEGEATVDPRTWLANEVTVDASIAYSHEEFEQCMGFIADGRLSLAPLHTTTVGLDDLDCALADLAGGSDASIKVLVDPRQ